MKRCYITIFLSEKIKKMLYSCPEYYCYRTDNSLPMLAKTDSPKKYSSLLFAIL